MDNLVSLGGPLENINGQLVLHIPLSAGGDKLIECTKGIGHVENGYLNIIIQPWLAEKLKLQDGSRVMVNNENGKFNITVDNLKNE
ncbi:MAG: hypothetical protein V1891_00200 [bacterium]